MDPVTTAILAAIAAGVASGVGDTAKQAVADAYGALKVLLTRKFGGSKAVEAVEKLEADPESAGWKETVAKEVPLAGADKDPDLLAAAKQVLAKLKALPQGEQHIMQATGHHIAQADRGGTAKVIHGKK